MNFSKHSNPRLSKTTESFQTNFNLCLVSFDCAIKGRLGRGREPTTSPGNDGAGKKRCLDSGSIYVFSEVRIKTCGWYHSLAPVSEFFTSQGGLDFPLRQLGHFYWTLLWTMTSSFSLSKCSERPALPQEIGNQQIPRFLPRWRWFRYPVLLLDVAGLCRTDGRDVSSRWISACWISTSQCWLWSSLARRCPQMINHFMKTSVNSIDKHCQAAPTKIIKLTWKVGKIKKESNCTDWRGQILILLASLSATRTMPRFPSRTSAPRPIRHLGGVPSSALAACGLFWSCPLVLIAIVAASVAFTYRFPLGVGSVWGYHIWWGGDRGQGSYHWA